MFWKRKEEPAVILIDSHKEIVAEYEKDAQRERDTAARLLERNIELQAQVDGRGMEIAALNEQCAGLLRDKIAESERANLAEQRVNSLLAEIAALRPDAEKHREKLRRDREHAENARERKRAARKEVA